MSASHLNFLFLIILHRDMSILFIFSKNRLSFIDLLQCVCVRVYVC